MILVKSFDISHLSNIVKLSSLRYNRVFVQYEYSTEYECANSFYTEHQLICVIYTRIFSNKNIFVSRSTRTPIIRTHIKRTKAIIEPNRT